MASPQGLELQNVILKASYSVIPDKLFCSLHLQLITCINQSSCPRKCIYSLFFWTTNFSIKFFPVTLRNWIHFLSSAVRCSHKSFVVLWHYLSRSEYSSELVNLFSSRHYDRNNKWQASFQKERWILSSSKALQKTHSKTITNLQSC